MRHARTWFNLTLVQTEDRLRQTVAQLREFLLAHAEANQNFQAALDDYLAQHPDHTERYQPLRV